MRSPTELLARFNRPLLVDGVDLSAQAKLAEWSVVVATDGASVADLAAETLLRYCAGAGVGAVGGPGAAPAAEIDEQVAALAFEDRAEPPVAHVYVAARDYGVSVDLVVTEDGRGWNEGRSHNARVCTAAFDFGREANEEDGTFVGAAGADLLLNHLLKLDDLPAIARFSLPDDGDPELFVEAGGDMVTAKRGSTTGGRLYREPKGFSLQQFAALPGELAAIYDDCRACYPNEACGYVLRRDGVLTTVVAQNVQDRYHSLDPTTYRRTARTAFKLNEMKIARALESGAELVCIYHSHCDAGAYFSNEDVECALLDGKPLFPGVSYLVVSVYGGDLKAAELYAFDTEQGTYAPQKHPAMAALVQTRKNYRAAVRNKSSGAWTWDLGNAVMRFDPAFKAQLGYTDEEVPDEPESWFNRLLPADGTRLRAELRSLVKGKTPLVQEEVRVQHRDGSYKWARITAALESGLGDKGVVTGTQEDITAVKLAELRLSYMEQHDALTGILNVDPFVAQLDEVLRSDNDGTLVICDLVDFREINKRFDRLTGDDTLIAIAGILEDQLDEAAVVGRLAGDLFGFWVASDLDAAVELVNGVKTAIAEEPFVSRSGVEYTMQAVFAVGGPDDASRFGRDWLDRVLCALKGDLPPGVVLVR